MGASVYAEHQHADMGPDTKSRDWNREINEPIAQPSPSPSPPFIGKVGGDVLFSPHGGAGIYKNATRGYKWLPNIIMRTSGQCNWALKGVPNI